MEHDCELTLDTNELELFLEKGDEPKDLGTALETMLKIANSKGKAVCIFTVHKSEDMA
jgi:hypothetical protein